MPAERWQAVRPWVRRGLIALGVLGAGAAVLSWVTFAPVAVEAHPVGRGPVVAEVFGTGTLEARVKATVGPKVAGRLKDVAADQGDRVSAGAVLLRMEDDELAQQAAVAEAHREAARAAVGRHQADVRRAAAVLAQARSALERTQTLVPKGAATLEDLDRATEAIRVAEAGRSTAEASQAEAERKVTAAEKTLAYHKALLADATVVAPFAGLVVRRHRDPGDVAVPASPVLTLISTDELWVSAWVDETAMAGLREGQPARITFRSEPERDFPGTVARLGREADRETREFVVDVRAAELPANWAVGQRADVYIETGRREDAVTLPARFVAWRDGAAGTFVADGGRAAWRPLQLGLRGRDVVEVLGGLEPGDVAVARRDPGDRLEPGRRVRTP